MPRKILSCLTPGSIGVTANQRETLQYAHDYGFEAIQPFGEELAKMAAGEVEELNARRQELRIAWGQGGFGVDFRKDEETFRAGLKSLPAVAAALQRAGATRLGTYILPFHDSLPYVANLRQHASRLRESGRILADHGLRLGLEYVGPKTLWTSRRYPFIHSMAEMEELLGEIHLGNVGYVLDTWHWYTAGESLEDLRRLKAEQIICLDLNDAPSGIPVDRQIDSQRELPLATGVIDAAGFLNVLSDLGCDAPARCEPFNAKLRSRPVPEILQTVSASMKRALNLIKAVQ